MNRVELGQIAYVEVLDEISEDPQPPDITSRELPDITWPSKHPDISYRDTTPLPQTSDILDAVFVVNRFAKKFDDAASDAYHTDQGAQARVYSLKKRALYRVKTVALHRLVKSDPDAISIERHNLNDDQDLLCLYMDSYHAFHQPIEAIDDTLIRDITGFDSAAELSPVEIDYSRTADTDSLEQSLDWALELLHKHGINANSYLDAHSVEDYNLNISLSTTFSSIPGEDE